ncbi:MAG: hypothetical protein ACI85K_002562 [Hyphomicrobiaceae bacterium]|jgi:hypothetical protein
MKINWKLTILAGLLGTLAFDILGLLITGAWWDIPQLLGAKLGTGTTAGVFAHYANGALLAVIYAAVAPSLWGSRVTRALTYVTAETVFGVWLFMLPLLGAGIAGIEAGIAMPFITLARHLGFGLVLAAFIPVERRAAATEGRGYQAVGSA